MKRILDEKKILEILREEWRKEVNALLEKHGKRKKPKKKPKVVKLEPGFVDELSTGLRIKHRETGLEYTILNIEGNDVTLLTPEGSEINLPFTRLKREYSLD